MDIKTFISLVGIMLFYVFLIVVLGFAGYYSLKASQKIGSIIGAVFGFFISALLWYNIGYGVIFGSE